MDIKSCIQLPQPKLKSLKTLVSCLKYSEGNNLLHQFIIDNSKPNSPSIQSYIRAVLLSFSKVSVNARNQRGFSALHLAVKARNYLLVKELLSCFPNINVNIKSKHQTETPLHCAASLKILESEFKDRPENLKKDLIAKARQEIADIIKLLITTGADLKAVNCLALTPLHTAALSKNWYTMKVLVECGADINSKERITESTPLHVIVTQNYGSYDAGAFNEKDISDIIKFLISHGADSSIKDENGSTPLDRAVMFKCWEIIKALVENGSAVDSRDSFLCTPLHHAVEENSAKEREMQKIPDIIELLIRNGADINAKDQNGKTPLHKAAKVRCCEAVKALVESGAVLDSKDEYLCTPLHMAVEQDRWISYNSRSLASMKQETSNIIKFLISCGADLNAKDQNGKTPLHKAVETNFWDGVKVLVESGAVVDCEDKNLCTPLHMAVGKEIRKGDRTKPHARVKQETTNTIVKFLISSGADLNAGDSNGETPLFKAVKARCWEAIKALVERGAIVDCKDRLLNTPLHIAVEQYEWERYNTEPLAGVEQEPPNIVKFLISNGALVNARNKYGETSLHNAVEARCWEAIKTLVESGADVDCKDGFLRTPLHFAVEQKEKERYKSKHHTRVEQEIPNIVKFLINSGADLNAEDESGETPLYLAMKARNRKTMNVLIDNGAVVNFKLTENEC